MNRLSEQSRRIVKQLLQAAATVAVMPTVVAYLVTGLVVSEARVFPGFSQLLSLVPGITGQFLRRAFYRLVLPKCGPGSCISFGTVFSHPTARLGSNVYIGVGCMIGDVKLEDDVLVGSHVSIINGRRQHGIERLDIPVRDQLGEYPRITIGADTWIGDRAVVTSDIGKHCVVGAGAVVTKPVPDFAIVVGNPARVQGFRGETSDNGGDHRSPLESSASVLPPENIAR